MEQRNLGDTISRQWRLHRHRLVRLAAVGGLVAVAVVVLSAIDILGTRGGETVTIEEGGESRTVVIEPTRLLDTLPPPGVAVTSVGPEEGKLAQDFEFSDMEGNRLKLSDFRGRPVFLNFWASWCGPCRQEMPDIQELQNRHQDEGLVILSLNRGESLKKAQDFLENIGVNLTVEGMDPSQKVYREYLAFPIEFMPTSVFIDEDGIISVYHAGLATLDQMEEFFAETIQPPTQARTGD
ncbi:MAG: TlpA family protein disulfide reductase [Dehalococcoidia bacterium]